MQATMVANCHAQRYFVVWPQEHLELGLWVEREGDCTKYGNRGSILGLSSVKENSCVISGPIRKFTRNSRRQSLRIKGSGDASQPQTNLSSNHHPDVQRPLLRTSLPRPLCRRRPLNRPCWYSLCYAWRYSWRYSWCYAWRYSWWHPWWYSNGRRSKAC